MPGNSGASGAPASPAATSGRCLDAAHGNGDRPERQRTAVRRAHLRRIEPQGTRDTHRSGKRRRRPPTAAHTDARQGSRRTDAVARSRREKQSLKGMRRRMRTMVLLRMLMQSPRTECRAQPAGHACGPPLREAAARMARRAEQRRLQIVRPDRLRSSHLDNPTLSF